MERISHQDRPDQPVHRQVKSSTPPPSDPGGGCALTGLPRHVHRRVDQLPISVARRHVEGSNINPVRWPAESGRVFGNENERNICIHDRMLSNNAVESHAQDCQHPTPSGYLTHACMVIFITARTYGGSKHEQAHQHQPGK